MSTGVVVHVFLDCFVLKSESGSVGYVSREKLHLHRGDVVEVLSLNRDAYGDIPFILALRHKVVGTPPPPSPQAVSIEDLNRLEPHFSYVVTTGVIDRVFHDELDPKWAHAILSDGSDFVTVSIPLAIDRPELIADILDSKVEVVGCTMLNCFGRRSISGLRLETMGFEDIKVLKDASRLCFDAPELVLQTNITLKEVFALGMRRATGRVIARWADTFLMRATNGQIVRVEPAFGQTLPAVGETVEVAGRAATDMFHINLVHARWRNSDRTVPADDVAPVRVEVSHLITNMQGNPAFRPSLYGTVVRVSGRVVRIPDSKKGGGRMEIVCDGVVIPVDASRTPEALAGLLEDCVVEVAGVYVLDTPNIVPGMPMPPISGFAVVVRSADDVRIVSHPPWLTAARLRVAALVLLAALLAVFVWNRVLDRIVRRKSIALIQEQIAHASSDLRVDERTRIAIELHDTLSQNLAGVAFQLTAAKSKLTKDVSAASRHVDTADRMLKSSRTELRRCLWDLREDTLENSDFTEAVAKTIDSVSGDAKVEVHFAVPRQMLSDTTAHAILRIVRELVSNAVVHGNASHVHIDGTCNDEAIVFSVSDDGVGFDPAGRPGPADGHFGLAGIEERVARFGGEMSIESAPGARTKIAITIKLHGRKAAES